MKKSGTSTHRHIYIFYSSGELFLRSQEGYFGIYFPSYEAARKINTEITLEWAQKQFVTRVHTLFYFLHGIDIRIHKWQKNADPHTWTPFLARPDHIFQMTSQSIADDVPITRQLWREHVKMISSLLDIDFIHDDFHGRSCKKQHIPYKMHILLWELVSLVYSRYIIKWKHFPRYWPFVGINRSPVNFPHKGQWRAALMFSLICALTNPWVNNRDAGDLRRSLWRPCNVLHFCEFAWFIHPYYVGCYTGKGTHLTAPVPVK